jgi:tetratricopeptide (TPR) repeat protein
MKSISKLKDEARRYEQREEWEKAIQAYLQVLQTADEGEAEVELPLYNRLGDLCVRLGKPQEAVRHYEQAADRYAEVGLYNNAIALCNKALRYSPDRLELMRKLGQFSASQGFITDARRYFLDYAERQFNAGKVSEALSALEDFANVSDDADVREMLGRQLQAHGRINDAVDELRRAYALRLHAGETEKADALRQEILAIDPKASIDGGASAPSGGARPQAGTALPGLVDIEPDPSASLSPDDPAAGGVAGLETGGFPRDDSGDVDAIQLAGFETTGQPDLADIDRGGNDDIEGLETTTLDFNAVESGSPVLEDLGLEREDTTFDGPVGPGEADVFDLPTLDDDSDSFDLPTLDDPAGDFDLPTLDDPDAPADLPTLDEPYGAEKRPTFDDHEPEFELSDTDDSVPFDLPLLGDDDPTEAADEATPLTPPQIDDEPAPEPPAAADSRDFDLGGDLPLDLNALGGARSFDLSPSDADTVDTPDWETGEAAFDIPELDGEALGLPTWEPEPGATFDLPSFDVDAGDDDAEPPADPFEPAEPEVPTETAGSQKAPADPTAERTTPDPTSDAIEAVSRTELDVPAIELPTWDTQPSPHADEGGAAAESETREPVWMESVADEDEDVSTDLPTFSYEDDDDASADVVASEEVEAAAFAEDDDPLGLAAHLPGRAPPRADPDVSLPEPLDSDWLDDLAAEDAAAARDSLPGQEPVAEEPTLDASPNDGDQAAEEPSEAAAAVDDVAIEAARAPEADRDLAAVPPPAVEAAPPPPAPRAEDYVDLGALVTGDDKRETTRFRVRETPPTGDEDRDFAELLSQFKAKVHQHLPPEDAAAHYDLGLAFKEMGLVDEAIGEFQIALRAGHMRLKVFEELGQCFLQKEQFNIAEKVLSRALTLKFDDELELLGVYYHLGRAYEALGRRDQARDAYERVLGMDINFGDVTDRLARL